jgi:predicted unusual protein kinase regulating ubiquinone biosynthesis (AarF/ABC1/UbiB family)
MTYEYRIERLAHSVAPEGVVEPYKLYRTDRGSMLITQYIPNSKKRDFKKIFKKVLKTLQKIQKVYPTFRHNDLHLKNIFVTPQGEAYIGDFGLANIEKDGYRNPMILDPKFKEEYGIYPSSDKRFDMHYMLNYTWVTGDEKTKKFIETLLPKEYLGQETSKVKTFRLRPNVSHKSLPTMSQIFSRL